MRWRARRGALVASLEDTLEETLTPRLILAGADLELVTFVRCHADTGGALDLTRHLGEIDRATAAPAPRCCSSTR